MKMFCSRNAFFLDYSISDTELNKFMRKRMLNEVLKGTTLSSMDAARLVLECLEEMKDLPVGSSRVETLAAVRRVLRAGVEVVRLKEQTVSFEQAAWESVEARAGRRPTTKRDLRNYVRRLLRVEGVAQLPLRSMSAELCRNILARAFAGSVNSYRKGRAVLHSIFAYGIRREWCDSNPVSRIEAPQVVERLIQPLSLAEVRRLKSTVCRPEFRDMRFSLSLLLYSGMRPAEVARLSVADVCWREKQVIVRPLASKTGGGRVVHLRPLADLRPCDCFVPANWETRWRALRRAAGFHAWVPDVCRHTFASYYAAYYRNLHDLQLEMGHRDSGLLRSRYMSPARMRDAAGFWRLLS